MKYATLCSGIEACSVAWHPLGWEPVFYSEIEPFPKAVLQNHYPNVPDHGDMTKYKNWPTYGTIDVICAGTPCQAFSVAGLRKGLEDPRGNLTLTFLGVLERYRPQWVVWENVPGVLSDRTNAFGNFLGGLAELGYGFAYRVLDAQYFGVAQRRRRVFVVGYLGDWRPAAAVLFEPSGLLGDPPPSRDKGQGTTGSAAPGAGNGGEPRGINPDAKSVAYADAQPAYYAHHPADSRIEGPMDVANTVSARYGTGGGNVPIIGQPAFGIPGNWIGRKPENGGNAVQPMDDISPSLTVADRHGVAQPIAFKIRGGKEGGGKGYLGSDETSFTLSTLQDQTLAHGMAVRRLTPIECERLQGFPDDYTLISWRGKSPDQCPDGPRYKALGNSMAVPVMNWIGRRIAEVNAAMEALR
jgi:DNA (cytosine-5)-methyltransferase 1